MACNYISDRISKYKTLGILTTYKTLICFICILLIFLCTMSLVTTYKEYQQQQTCRNRCSGNGTCIDEQWWRCSEGLQENGRVKIIVWVTLLGTVVGALLIFLSYCFIRIKIEKRKIKVLKKIILSADPGDDKSKKQENYSIEKLPDQSIEKQYVLNLIRNTWVYETRLGKDSRGLKHNTISVKQVFRVHNKCLWERYQKTFCVSKWNWNRTLKPLPKEIQDNPIITTMTRICDDGVNDDDTIALKQNEVHMFHGTKLYSIPGIIERGFDLSLARRGLYGEALYMAESSEKADQYSDQKTHRQDNNLVMVIVRVNLGNVYVHVDKTITAVNLIKEHGKSQYNTVVAGLDKRFREFLVFDTKRCFPEYLVVYERTYEDSVQNV